MTLPQFNLLLLVLWITVTVVALLGLSAILIWAVRTRQFSNQDYARYLPLRSGIPENDGPAEKKEELEQG